MLKRVRIKGYKSLEDAKARLEPLAVLFGPNAAGKSNFLDALQLLSKLGTSATLKGTRSIPPTGANRSNPSPSEMAESRNWSSANA